MGRQMFNIIKKETYSCFEGVQAWVVLSVYIFISMFLTFFIGGFFSIDNTGLFSFFCFQPYLMSFLVPALTMRLWAEERKNGTLEFLLTQPISLFSIIMGKFLSAWFICFCMFLLSTPLWLYLNIYFEADNMNILSGYFACILVSGSFCALGCLISSFCSSPAVSYLWSLIVFFSISVSDFSGLIKSLNLPLTLENKLNNMLSLNSHYYDLMNGQIGWDNIMFFVLLMIAGLWLNVAAVEYKKN